MSNRNSLTYGATWPVAWTRIGYFLSGSQFKKQISAEKSFGRYTNKKESNRTVGGEWLQNAALVLVVFKHTSLPVWRGQFESDMLLKLILMISFLLNL